jgi:hypothetical protein
MGKCKYYAGNLFFTIGILNTKGFRLARPSVEGLATTMGNGRRVGKQIYAPFFAFFLTPPLRNIIKITSLVIIIEYDVLVANIQLNIVA